MTKRDREGARPGKRAGVFDAVRGRTVASTPEEAVRQAVLGYLQGTLGVPPRLIGVEFCLAALDPGNTRRVDIVVWKPGPGQLAPWLLVECKAPAIAIDDAVAGQAARYLGRVASAYVMLSNGTDSRYLERYPGGYREISALPYFR